jgi:glycosyltransferase involved in cell wall biosynthesis
LSAHADRVVVSLLDLIAYQNGSYFASGDAWAAYRDSIVDTLRAVDGATTISRDVMTMVQLERLPISDDRLFPVPYGTEHVQEDAPKRMPDVFDGRPDAEFLLCLGTNYGHKNRDLAIRTVDALRRRGHDLQLVLAGPAVPYGTSRQAEADASYDLNRDAVIALSDVTSEERNWLMAHTVAVLYPTSAEGFGLVPYEAAWLGAPTVFVPFGPLAEIAGELPVTAREWSAEAFADAVEEQIRDPQLGAAQVQRLKEASARWSWAATAELLTQVFRTVLGRPRAAVPIPKETEEP